jgi:prokaryotic ubiquitin-like protein Pup
MSEQQFEGKTNSDEQISETPAIAKLDVPDISGLLSQIDAVLEQNAEEFVKGFVQKGGQ